MKCLLAIGAVLASLCGPAAAATVTLAPGSELRLELHDVAGASFDFALPETWSGWAGYGGYLKWSTRLDGRQDWDGPWSTCLECGYDGGSWALDPSNAQKTVALDFGALKDTVYVWIRPTWGNGRISWADPVPDPDPVPAAVPLPAGGLLLIGALAGLTALRRRKAA